MLLLQLDCLEVNWCVLDSSVFVPQDDIIDDVDSFVAAAETLKERGAYKIFVMATHGILSSEAPRFIEESAIDEVRVPLYYSLILMPSLHLFPSFNVHS